MQRGLPLCKMPMGGPAPRGAVGSLGEPGLVHGAQPAGPTVGWRPPHGTVAAAPSLALALPPGQLCGPRCVPGAVCLGEPNCLACSCFKAGLISAFNKNMSWLNPFSKDPDFRSVFEEDDSLSPN